MFSAYLSARRIMKVFKPIVHSLRSESEELVNLLCFLVDSDLFGRELKRTKMRHYEPRENVHSAHWLDVSGARKQTQEEGLPKCQQGNVLCW